MKTTIKIFSLAIAIIGFSATSFAQVHATATASGTIVTPIAISKTVDMNFGNVAVSSSAGTVVLAAAGTRSATGGVTLPATSGTVAAAQFTVTGESGYTYSVTLPASNTVKFGSNTMTVNTFVSNTTGKLTGGTEILKVGATLNVGASQAAGTYISEAPFTVTVNYN